LKIELSFIIAFKWGTKVKNMLLVQESGKVEKKLKKKKKKRKGSKSVFTAEHIDNIANFNNDIDISLNNSLENLDDDVFLQESANSPNETKFQLTGRRIVDVNHLFLTLKSIKHQGFDCSFYDVDIINEKRYGLKSYFSYKCTICGLEGTFSSEPDTDSSEINKSAVCGIIAMGAGFTQFSYLSAALDIPCMSSSTYFAVENQVLNYVKEVAINEMIDAGQEELRLAVEAGEVDSNGVGMITVIVDGAWSKRSYKTNYNALSGVASIIGAR
jgi:hypothetical protein